MTSSTQSPLGQAATHEGADVGRGATAQIQTSQDRELSRLLSARRAVLADRVVRLAMLAAVLWCAAYGLATYLTQDRPAARQALGDLVYLLPIALATGLSARVVMRARGRRRRLWRLLLASNTLWLAGDLIWAAYPYLLHREAPFPSVADALYVSSYLLVAPAVLVGFAGASGRRKLRAALDAGVIGLAVGILGWQGLIAPQLGGEWSWATATGVAYPLLGVVIIVTVLAVGLGGHRQVAPSVWLIGLAFVVSALTDAGFTYLVVLHEYLPGAWLNLGWQLEAVLLCVAAACALRHDEGDGQVVPLARDLALAPVLTGVAIAVVVAAQDALGNGASILDVSVAVVAICGLAARSLLSVSDTRRVAEQLGHALREQQRLAVTDGLTGLYNRRFFEEVLGLEADRTRRQGGSVALLVADLDHFKAINDTHGHQSGDQVLKEVASRLRRALRDVDVLARYGGEEFVMVLPGADADTAMDVAERCRRALALTDVAVAAGAEVALTASFGVATLPADAEDIDDLIRLADRALYAAKDRGRDQVVLAGRHERLDVAARAGGRPAGLRALEHLADLVEHRSGRAGQGAAVAQWAGVLADALGMDAAARERTQLGVRLRDIGKLALGDQLLLRPGPLDARQWQLVCDHPAQGARLLADLPGCADLARVVAEHHERWDGGGYPSGVPAERLSLETRVVSVCDTWAAMRSARPHAAALDVDEAVAQLVAARGGQLDPHVVDTFVALQAAGRLDELPASAAVPVG